EVAASMRALYPSLRDVPVTNAWMGPIDRTEVGLPFFSRLGGRDDVLFGVGYSGNGVGPSFLGGRMLASLALELDDEWSQAGLVREPVGSFPPEPVRYLGGVLVLRAVERKEAVEAVGRRAGTAKILLIGIPPLGLVPLRKQAVDSQM